MIEIKPKNGIWEVYINGGLFYYNSELDIVLGYLSNNVQNVTDELQE